MFYNLTTDKWSPALQIRTVLLSIQALLSAPNPDDPLANDVAELWKIDEEKAIKNGMSITRTQLNDTGLIKIFSRRATGFRRQANLFQLNFFLNKNFALSRWLNLKYVEDAEVLVVLLVFM